MAARHFLFRKTVDLFLVLLCLLVLLPCLYYPYAGVHPDFGFVLSLTDWKILSTPRCEGQAETCLQAGDRLVSIEGVTLDEFRHDRGLSVPGLFGSDGVAHLELIRDGKLLTRDIRVRAKRADVAQILFTMMAPLIFWLMGTIVIIFLRPRDERWLILVLFSYDIALWIAAGLANQAAWASYVFHVVIWFFLPLSLHLHTILPSKLFGRLRAPTLAALYAFGLALTVLDGLFLLHRVSYAAIWCTLAAVVLSMGLLCSRLVLPSGQATKVAARIMLFGVIFGLGPFLIFHGVLLVWLKSISLAGQDLRWFQPYMTGISTVTVPILPMAYIYAIYKHHLGTLEFRANRFLGIYAFSALSFVSYAIIFLALSSHWPKSIPGDFLTAVFVVSLVYVAATPWLRERFQVWVDRHVFGIKHSAREVIGLVAERIPTAFDREVLAGVVADEILPALLIRQSALYLMADGRRESLYEQAVPAGEPEPSMEELTGMLVRSGRYLPSGDPAGAVRSWVRLVIPLVVQAKTVGVWLIGRRDPDDYFPASDIHLLSTVANQIAPMAENVRLYEKAQEEIRQRKAAEEAIRRSEERFRTLFEATLEGIAIVRNGIILEVNKALPGIFGYEPAEILGRPLSDLVPDEVDLEGMTRESIGFARDGGTVDIEVAGKRYLFQGEEVSVVAIRDIARRKHDEAENKMLQRQLLHSAKMEAIGRLSAGVAHDFNNCLLAIFGYSDLLLERYSEDLFLARNLTGIKEAGQRAAALTKQLLAFARRQPMETKVMNVNGVVSGLEKMLQRLLGEDIHLSTELHPELGKVKIDSGQIEQVIVNLAVNARHAMPKGGRLSLRTAPVEVTGDNPAPHSDVPPGSFVVLTVTDTGMGMDAVTQARVFEPFFSTKGEGTGLGLSTAYGIVRQSGGHIFVNSAPEQGASFAIYLPVTREAEAVRIGTAASVSGRGEETILLVEDEDEVRTVLHQILVSRGYRVLQAGSGEEALVISRLHRGPVHLLLTDIMMPQMKGPELAQRLRSERPATRVVFMSGYNDEQLSDGGPDLPLCLQKPFTPNLLGETVRSVLDTAEDLRATG
ncbi:MAG TPA: ATP-binding protein [Thermoanaerobaculia bacterium]|nr:ATP-binding protein [Thermoanaerobaculia bacterium]